VINLRHLFNYPIKTQLQCVTFRSIAQRSLFQTGISSEGLNQQQHFSMSEELVDDAADNCCCLLMKALMVVIVTNEVIYDCHWLPMASLQIFRKKKLSSTSTCDAFWQMCQTDWRLRVG
jgi:hypothetical protein